MNWYILGIGALIFFARIVDVSIGTLRTMVTVQGRIRLAFVLGFIEVTLWVTIISAIVKNIQTAPVLAVFYGLGFATGNAVGILAERKLGLGHVALRVFTRVNGEELAENLRDQGQPVTIFHGEGRSGPVGQLMMVCGRKQVNAILEQVCAHDPDAFYLVEFARDVSRLPAPLCSSPTGWRAVLKKK
jgi:uncharacterized protein YebE (UPF0316 family)